MQQHQNHKPIRAISALRGLVTQKMTKSPPLFGRQLALRTSSHKHNGSITVAQHNHQLTIQIMQLNHVRKPNNTKQRKTPLHSPLQSIQNALKWKPPPPKQQIINFWNESYLLSTKGSINIIIITIKISNTITTITKP